MLILGLVHLNTKLGKIGQFIREITICSLDSNTIYYDADGGLLDKEEAGTLYWIRTGELTEEMYQFRLRKDIYLRGGMVIVKHLIQLLTGTSLHLIQTVNMLCCGIARARLAVMY